jgi:hypothetical protein
MNPYIQVFLAIIIVIILFVGALMVYNKETVDAIRQSGNIKKIVPIFSGIIDFYERNDIVYNTLDPNAANYINMGNSINQVSGGEYSYNFWLYVDNTGNTIFAATNDGTNTNQIFADNGLTTGNTNTLPFVLFLRGSNKVLEYKNQCSSNRNSLSPETNSQYYKNDVLVKSPLVKLEHGGDVLSVEFNTLDSPDGVKDGARNTCVEIDTDWSFINQYKVGLKNMSDPNIQKQWNMISIVLQDTLPEDPYPLRNKIRCRIYINGALKLDKYVVGQLGNSGSSKPLRMNQGNLYINPTLKINTTDASMTHTNNSTITNHTIMMADLTYYNYALTPDEISSLFAGQFNKKNATTANSSTTVLDNSYLTVSKNVDPQAQQIYK